MKLKTTILLLSGLFVSTATFAQEENPVEQLNQRVTLLEDAAATGKKLKISGYIQAQVESTEKQGSLKVGEKRNDSTEVGDINRFGIRRGRIKLAYDDNGYQGVLQFDLTEKGMALKDAYISVLDPWVGYASVKGGVYDRPFGYEISYSSSRRESPERSMVFQTLFPDERDLGFMLTLQPPKTSPWNVLKLEAGLFAGNGIYKETDNKKDFIGHLSYNKAFGNFKVGLGASMYSGFVLQSTSKVYEMSTDLFKLDATATNKGKFAKRDYFGIDGQLSFSSFLGLTTLRAEYLAGTQPGTSKSSSSPKSGNIPGYASDNKFAMSATTDVYKDGIFIRKFQGAYVHLTQDIADTKHSITLKYDTYDPNTKVSGLAVGGGTAATGFAKTNQADIAYSTFGVGYLYRMNNNVRIMAYYDMVKNEKTSVTGYKEDRKDNVFTLRVQYKF